jgi:hypothetical protein
LILKDLPKLAKKENRRYTFITGLAFFGNNLVIKPAKMLSEKEDH